MNKKQWYVLGIFFILMGIVFIKFDTSNLPCLDVARDTPATQADVVSSFYCVLNAEIYEPFIWLFPLLGLVCFILGGLEPKEKR